MKKAKKLTAQERDLIAIWRSRGVTMRQIAKDLHRSHATVIREVRRNRFGTHYVAIHAHALARRRKAHAGKRHPLKNPWLYAYVVERLRWGWSPEQIAGRLTKEHPNVPSRNLCHETIYRFIYAEENQDQKLWEHLPWKRKKRKKKQGRKVHKSRIPDRVSIHHRPDAVNQRLEFGHWEGDSLIGRRERGKVIHTTAERRTRFFKAVLADSLEAHERSQKQYQLFAGLPKPARKSTTLDNGKEFTQHKKLHKLGMRTYFADPYSAWQRGTIEHQNGLLRRYLPKSTSFDALTQQELDDIVEEINDKPRKVLHYQTPKEAFREQLGGAIQR